MTISSSNVVRFYRFLPADWSKGLFVVSTYGYHVMPVKEPLWLTSHLLRAEPSGEGFLGWLFTVAGVAFTSHEFAVSVPRFGAWEWVEPAPDISLWKIDADPVRELAFASVETNKAVVAPRLYREWSGKISGRYFLFQKPGSAFDFELPTLWRLEEQFCPWLPEGAEGYAFMEEIAAVKHAVESWLLRCSPFLVPAERKVSRAQWEKAQVQGLPTELREVISFRECTATLDEEGNPVLKGKADSRIEYLVTGEYMRLSPSQRVAVFSLPQESWEDMGWSEEKDREAWEKRLAWGDEYWEGFLVNPNILQRIAAYRRRQWEFTIATPEMFMSRDSRENLVKKVPFWPAKDLPAGWLFSSTSLLSLVWAEIYWCAANNVEANYCQGCGRLFAAKRGAEVCSKKCSETVQAAEKSVRQSLKELHQQLTRLAAQMERGEATLDHYLGLWKKWKRLKHQATGRGKPAKKIHPALVALRLPEGKEKVRAVREAGSDTYAREDAWKKLLAWLREKVPLPPEEWEEWVREEVLARSRRKRALR